ncbi:leucine-rich repeat-containing protein 74A-like [Mercenaria mercenaria]|uniref:leucine-rich repeat-containing protein 74A-like n=1 Tax=Mercenaria mercenaria TaxID=6596 RepID=UPI00234EC185|nr:leucine-rich repeat-containing protein 74A-like [Mercenaria mercenaria]
MKANKCLRSLNVAWNGFGKEGAKALGEALPENDSLTELDVTNNRINANGMALFMIGLRTNETLQSLKLGMNPFSSEVAKHLLLIIEANEKCALTHLEMSDVSVDEDVVAVLERLAGNRHLSVNHGKIVRKVPEKPYVPPPLPPRDPLELMFEFKYEHGYRTLDLLMRMDKDNNMVVDREEFKNGLLEMDIEADDDQIDELMSRLDTNSDGNIDYSEFVQGEKEYGSRQKRHMNMQTLGKIRSLAAAMLKLRVKAHMNDAETRRLSTQNTESKLTAPK